MRNIGSVVWPDLLSICKLFCCVVIYIIYTVATAVATFLLNISFSDVLSGHFLHRLSFMLPEPDSDLISSSSSSSSSCLFQANMAH